MGWILQCELANMESSGATNPPSCLPNPEYVNPEDFNPLTFQSDWVQTGPTRSDKHGNYGFYRLFDPHIH